MNILSTIETAGTTRTDTVVSQSLDGLLLERLVRVKVVVVIGTEIGDRPTVAQLRLGSNWAASHQQSAYHARQETT